MYKLLVVAAVVGWAWGYPLTQEELAQYVARQQTSGAVQPRRQQYILQPQARQAYQQEEEPQEQQVYQPQPQYYQPQEQQYVRQPQRAPIRAQPPRKGAPQEPEDYDPNPQYQFAFDIKDDEFTNYQQRKEQREGDKISGSYSVVDSDGYIRTVTYTADPLEGFKADVVRQPTDIKIKIPVPLPQTQKQQYVAYQPQTNLVQRKQQTQQYLQASTPVQAKPQYVLRPEHTQVYTSSQPQQVQGLQAYAAQPKQVKASAIGFAQQPTASPILYQAYQQ